MPTHQHAQQPNDHPARRALDEWALAEIAATMRPCPEVPRHVRAGWAALAADRDQRLRESAQKTTARKLRKVS